MPIRSCMVLLNRLHNNNCSSNGSNGSNSNGNGSNSNNNNIHFLHHNTSTSSNHNHHHKQRLEHAGNPPLNRLNKHTRPLRWPTTTTPKDLQCANKVIFTGPFPNTPTPFN